MIKPANVCLDRQAIELVVKAAFADGSDSDIQEWFSFSIMAKKVEAGEGVCLKAVSESGEITGVVYAQQENPVNGKEGIEKWVIVMVAVSPSYSGRGIGKDLLKGIEVASKPMGCKKMFVYTNKGDDKVVNFYLKNGYQDAGYIKDYQYGNDNSAVFMLKHLNYNA